VTPKISLSRDLLVERALKIADTDGLEALTIRRLADEFQVTPMAMYWHFANKDALLAAIGGAVIETVDLPARDDDLSTFLTAAMTTLVDAMRAHPSVAPLVARQILHSERGCDLTEFTLEQLANAGFDVDQAAAIAHNAMQIAVMLVTGEPGNEVGVPPEERDGMLAGKLEMLQSLPADRFPRLVAAAPALTSCADSEDYYEVGISTFVAGIVHGITPRTAGTTR
jgi:TetR/AcrR family tetracycline transcriptional repressor